MPTTIADAFGKSSLHDGFVKSALHERDPKPASVLAGWSKILVYNTTYGWPSFVSESDTSNGNFSRVWSRIFLRQEYTRVGVGLQFHQKECFYSDFVNIDNGFAPDVFGVRYMVESESKSAGFDANVGIAHPFLADQQTQLTPTRSVYRRWRRTSEFGDAFALDTIQELRGDTVRAKDFANEWFAFTNSVSSAATFTPPAITPAQNPTVHYKWNTLGNLQPADVQNVAFDPIICPGYEYNTINYGGSSQRTAIGISQGHSATQITLRWRSVRLQQSGGVVNEGRVTNANSAQPAVYAVLSGPDLKSTGPEFVAYPPLSYRQAFTDQINYTLAASWRDCTIYEPIVFLTSLPRFTTLIPVP